VLHPRHHINDCVTNWILVALREWTHYFFYTLEGIPSNWYKEWELHEENVSWGIVQQKFIKNFAFESENPWVDLTLQRMKRKLFEEYGIDIVTVDKDYKK
jgi:hypothetical protein